MKVTITRTKTHASRAYQHLRSKLISGEFEPGTRLLYGPIGKEIGISATPVREAAGQLANEGLLELIPKIGAVVCQINRQELVDIYEVRLAIEPYAARLAAQRASPQQVRRLEGHVTRMRELTDQLLGSSKEFAGKRIVGQFEKSDYAFHMEVIAASGNQAMVRTAGQSHALTRVFGVRRHRYDATSMRATCEDHEAILDAIRASSAINASTAATTHIENGLARSLAALDRAHDGESS
ncbi:GntR family transcriptional regulator [Crateriforma conspicua]|uniref:GntR family transcriptional regulator n=1 Tax=Crateriforma conspicua TaxID=2527996 RepID=UPI001E50E06A|nr:GntR family transcriptional regulator [Crateriforma conspicua]